MGYLDDWWKSAEKRIVSTIQNVPSGKEADRAATGMIGDVTGTFKGGPGSYLNRQSESVDSIAQKEAATSADLATKQAVRGAKTAGMMGGQAALAASRQAADAYSGSLANARQGLRDQYSQAAGMQTGAMGALAGIGDAKEKNRLTKRGQNMGLATQIVGAGAEVAKVAAPMMLASDRNVKTDVQPTSMGSSLDKIKAYTYRYKGSNEPQAGVMAQDLEKGVMAPAVVNNGGVKMVDTGKLSLMNTGALAEQEKRMKRIESIVKAMEEGK